MATLRAASARQADRRPIFGEWDGSETGSAASRRGPGERRMNAAVSIEANLTVLNQDLRLEHELQTAMGRRRKAQPQFR